MTDTAAPPWLSVQGDAMILQLHIQPAAKQTAVVGLHGAALKVRLAAPPVDGKANAALLAFIAKKVGVGKTATCLLSGQSSRVKRVRIAGVTAATVIAALQPPIAGE
jgi:uncharacterized protein (TIGR00251 family)